MKEIMKATPNTCDTFQMLLLLARTLHEKNGKEYIVQDGAFTIQELNEFEPDLWKTAIVAFGAKELAVEMQKLSKFILKAA